MENFMPKGLSEIKLDRDWSVAKIIAIYDDKKVPFAVMGGKLKKLPTPHIISKNHFNQINNQVQKIKTDYEKRANLARELKKPNWAFDLEKYGVIIEKDGCLKISRWITDEANARKRIWQTLQEIESAIRQQNHIIKEYLEKKNGPGNNQEVSHEFSNLFKQLHIILPHIEMRRLLLIRAQEQMDMAIRRTIKGLELLLSAKGRERENCHGVPEKLKRLAFFLNNSWSRPYREKIDQILPLIKEAKKFAVNLQWNRTKLLLLSAKNVLTSALEVSGRQSQLIAVSEIGPIQILAEVDKYNLSDDVMILTKEFLTEPPYYYKKLGLFRLSAILAVSQLVITGKPVCREEILKLLN